jgi:uncharacterized lipoprotein YddW (UPF0748 family)
MNKAVWLTNVDSQVLSSRENLKAGLNRLAQLGFNTIYPCVWQRGFTLYPSSIAQDWIGAAIMPNSPFVGRDVLAEIINIATPLKMRVMPWFEYGLMLPPQSSIASQFPELISIDHRGDRQRIIAVSGKQDPHIWMNPCIPQVQDFMVDLITDLVQRYPVAGIQLDDHFGFPQELGFDRFSQDLFKQQRGKVAPTNHADPAWIDWGCEMITNLLDHLNHSVKSVRPNCLISVSPNPLDFSRRNYLADWQGWHSRRLIDELVLQVYRDNLFTFKTELNKPEVRSIQQKIPTSIGILTGLKNKPIDDELIKQQIKATIDQNFAGVAYFFYQSIFDRQMTPISIARTPEMLKDIFG